MSLPSPDLQVLHALAVRGPAGVDPVAAAAGLDRDQVMRHLIELDDEGLVQLRTGRGAGWVLAPAGRARVKELLAESLDRGGHRAPLEACYERFAALNGPLKALATRWQLRSVDPMIANDHDDPAYDREIVDRLAALHREVVQIVADAAGVLPWFGPYADRLAHALEGLAAGGLEWLTKPGIGSYHDVWMQLHQDFLLTLGRERGAEDA